MKNAVKFGVAVLTLCLAISNFAIAAIDDIKFQKKAINIKQQSVGGILRDSDGIIWIGGASALSKYDGYQFKECKQASGAGTWIVSIVEDKDGILWFGTHDGGLTEYDKRKNTWTIHKHSPDKNSISSNVLPYANQSLFVDESGKIWVATENSGLNKYDRETGVWTHFKHHENAPGPSSDKITAIAADKKGVFWIGTMDGGLNRFEVKKNEWTHYKHDPENGNSISDNHVQSIHCDSAGLLWVGTRNGGLNKFVPGNETFFHYRHDPQNPDSIGDDNVYHIMEDSSGLLWVTKDQRNPGNAGLSVLDKKSGVFRRFLADPENPFSPDSNLISDVYESPESGIIWLVNTYSGSVDKFDKKALKFKWWDHSPHYPDYLRKKAVTGIFEDSGGIIWIGTLENGLVKYDRKTNEFTQYAPDKNDPDSFPHHYIDKPLEDSSGEFWAGSAYVLCLFDRETGKVVRRYENDPDDPESIVKTSFIRKVLEDRDDPDIFWIATHESGLERFDKKTGTFRHYRHDPDDPNSLSHDSMRIICDDGKGFIWVPTFNGLSRLDKKSGVFKRYLHDPGDPKSIFSNFLFNVTEDLSGDLWIGGKGGVARFDRKTETFTNYTREKGFVGAFVSNLTVDDEGVLWLATNKGLLRFVPEIEKFTIYTQSDGLKPSGFLPNANWKTKDGEIWIGGFNGLNSFHPGKLKNNPYIPPVVLTSFTQGGIEVNTGTAPEKMKHITLDWKNNYFEFQFAAFNYTRPEKNRYAYMLEGVDDGWYYSGSDPKGRYAGLSGGEYTLRLKGSNNDGIWNQEGASVKITVVPPYWRTWQFQTGLAAFMIFAVVGGFVVRLKTVERRRRELELQVGERTHELKIAKEKAESANRTKSAFLANMSHELRTPLNAILGFARIMERNERIPSEERENLITIKKSGKHLLTLINDVLDFSKIEAGRMTLNEKHFDLRRLLDELKKMVGLKALNKGLKLEFVHSDDLPRYVCTDEIKLRQVLINLINNAIKFTKQGKVTVRAAANGLSHDPSLIFEVEDTGPGISADESALVFEAFEQTKTGREAREGTGLGLPISRKFARMMGGDISVSSEEGRGSVFTFHICVKISDRTDIGEIRPARQIVSLEAGQPKYRILVVDDNPMNRNLLVKLLTPLGFELKEAADGREAIDIWENWEPHLIWLDMRMPIMDGYETAKWIKSTTRGQASAVIALTASNLEEEQTIVLSAGCNDFLRKPFREKDVFDLMQKHIGVRYVYKDDPKHDKADQTENGPGRGLESVGELPDEILAELRNAVSVIDYDMTSNIIERKIRKINVSLADALVDLLKQFRFDKLQNLFEEKDEDRKSGQ